MGGDPGNGGGDLEEGMHCPITFISIIITVNLYLTISIYSTYLYPENSNLLMIGQRTLRGLPRNNKPSYGDKQIHGPHDN